MSNFNIQITNLGRSLQTKAQTGVPLVFTRMRMGSGSMTGQQIADMTALITPQKWLTLNKSVASATGRHTLGAPITNSDVSVGFFFREIGVFATDPDIGEILYCYGNVGTGAEFIPAGGGSSIINEQFDVIAIIGAASNVSATVDTSLVFPSKAEFEAHINDSVKHVTASDKTAWNAKETPTGAQLKADAAQSAAISAASADATSKANVVQANLTNHDNNTTKHITSAERVAWNAKQTALGFTPENITNKNTASGYVGLDSNRKIPPEFIHDSIIGQVEYQGTWNGATNAPTLPAATSVKGHYYVVSVSGTHSGITFDVGDWIISNGAIWQKVNNTDAVSTVFGRSGNVVAADNDYTWKQVDKTVSDIKDITTRNLSDLTQTATHRTVSDTEKSTWNSKANATNATTSVSGLMSASDKNKLDGVAANANNYSHPTGSGNNHIPVGGTVGQFLKNSAAGTATWATPTNSDVGLSNVDNTKQATKVEFDTFKDDTVSQLADISIHVRSKGAKVDGVTDDTTAVQTAIDEVHAKGGGVVSFPTGTCMVSGLILKDFVTLQGVGKLASVIKLINGSNDHVISTPNFDALIGTNPTAEFLVKTGGVKYLTIDGNKSNQTLGVHGLAYLGIDLQLDEVEIKNCKGLGLCAESSTGIWSVTVGQNLQSNIRHIEVHDNDLGNIYYNGQSDSNMIDVMCYETKSGAGQFNFKFGPNAMGSRVFGLHCWGVSDYGVIVEAESTQFTSCHVESAAVAKVWLKKFTVFEGRIYEVGSNNAAPAFLIESAMADNRIEAQVFNCNIAVKFKTVDGGSGLYDIMMYSSNPSAILFDGTLSATNYVRARVTGAVQTNVFMTPNMKQVPGGNWDFSTTNNNYAFYTDESKSLRQFGIEHLAGATSWIAATGGIGSPGGALLARGAANDIDLRLLPQGAGKVRFGTHVAGSGTVSGYIEIKDANGTIRKLAVIN